MCLYHCANLQWHGSVCVCVCVCEISLYFGWTESYLWLSLNVWIPEFLHPDAANGFSPPRNVAGLSRRRWIRLNGRSAAIFRCSTRRRTVVMLLGRHGARLFGQMTGWCWAVAAWLQTGYKHTRLTYQISSVTVLCLYTSHGPPVIVMARLSMCSASISLSLYVC